MRGDQVSFVVKKSKSSEKPLPPPPQAIDKSPSVC